MTKKEIEKGNKAIQQWLYENVGIGYWSSEPLCFYSDYGWLMPVLERIEDRTDACFQIYKRAVVCIFDYNEHQLDEERTDLIIYVPFNRKVDYVPFYKLHSIYKCVLAYIDWSNKQKLK